MGIVIPLSPHGEIEIWSVTRRKKKKRNASYPQKMTAAWCSWPGVEMAFVQRLMVARAILTLAEVDLEVDVVEVCVLA